MPSATEVRAAGANTTFGERLRRLRLARGLRQRDLAGAEYSAPYISMLESGRTRASMKALEHLSAKLGVSVTELLGGEPKPDQIEATLMVAGTLLEAEQPERAYELITRLSVDGMAPRQVLRRLRLEGRALIALRRAQEALGPLNRALSIAHSLDDAAEVARVRFQLGTACYYTFAYPEALQHHLAALEACQRGQLRDAHFEFRLLAHLGNDHAALEEHPAAIGYYERALALAQDLVDQERIAGIHAGLAFSYTQQHDYEAAIRQAQASLTLYEKIGAERTVPEVMNNLAYLYGKVGNSTRADELLRGAIERAAASGNRYAMPHLLLSRAELLEQREPARARQLAEEALHCALESEQRRAILSARLFIARLEEDPVKGRKLFEECERLAQAHEPKRLREVLEAWSEWEERRGDPRRAARFAREARRV